MDDILNYTALTIGYGVLAVGGCYLVLKAFMYPLRRKDEEVPKKRKFDDSPEAKLFRLMREKERAELEEKYAAQKAREEREARNLEEFVQSSGIRNRLIGTSLESLSLRAIRLWNSHEERKRNQDTSTRAPKTEYLFAFNVPLPGSVECQTVTVEELDELIKFENERKPKQITNVIKFDKTRDVGS